MLQIGGTFLVIHKEFQWFEALDLGKHIHNLI